jgi:predicted protein tyrosine phosphatase
MSVKKKILFVCTINRMRSATAEKVFEGDERFEVKSAGTHYSAAIPLTQELLDWADTVIVMEKYHRNQIRKRYPDIYDVKRVVCLYIPDEYEFMQAELIEILKLRLENAWKDGII